MLLVCGYVSVEKRERRRWGKRSPEENWPYGMVDIKSLNKRLMPKAHKDWAEEMEGEETEGERKKYPSFFFFFKMTVCYHLEDKKV